MKEGKRPWTRSRSLRGRENARAYKRVGEMERGREEERERGRGREGGREGEKANAAGGPVGTAPHLQARPRPARRLHGAACDVLVSFGGVSRRIITSTLGLLSRCFGGSGGPSIIAEARVAPTPDANHIVRRGRFCSEPHF